MSLGLHFLEFKLHSLTYNNSWNSGMIFISRFGSEMIPNYFQSQYDALVVCALLINDRFFGHDSVHLFPLSVTPKKKAGVEMRHLIFSEIKNQIKKIK